MILYGPRTLLLLAVDKRLEIVSLQYSDNEKLLPVVEEWSYTHTHVLSALNVQVQYFISVARIFRTGRENSRKVRVWEFYSFVISRSFVHSLNWSMTTFHRHYHTRGLKKIREIAILHATFSHSPLNMGYSNIHTIDTFSIFRCTLKFELEYFHASWRTCIKEHWYVANGITAGYVLCIVYIQYRRFTASSIEIQFWFTMGVREKFDDCVDFSVVLIFLAR